MIDGRVQTNALPTSWPAQLCGVAPSLRVFEHLDEIYKERGLPEDCPRYGDYAEIVKSHCVAETGLLVHVTEYVHWCILTCADCGTHMRELQVKIEPLDPDTRARWEIQAPGGPWLYPIAWLKRWRPDQVRAHAR